MLIDYHPSKNRTHYYPNLDADCPTIALAPSVPDEASFCTRAAFDGPAAYWPYELEAVVYDWAGVWSVRLTQLSLDKFYSYDMARQDADRPSFSHRMF